MTKAGHQKEPTPPYFIALATYYTFSMLVLFGQLRDFFANLTGHSRYLFIRPRKGYAQLLRGWETFFTRRLYHRVQDAWNRPITGPPGAHINIIPRSTTDNNATLHVEKDKEVMSVLNLGSYNYLGFADDWNSTCKDEVFKAMEKFDCSMASSRADVGTTSVHKELERTVAKFVGKDDAIVFNMGYGTNCTTVPALMGKGSLIISDSLNHTSIVNGARASGARIKVFNHNDAKNLEVILREAIVDGQPRTHRPWTKILVMIEGVYSMEGEIVDLPAIVDVCKRYKAYIYLDEAHSIGACGRTGRGVCEHWGVDPKDIDIMMGTFTKSFGAMGGYIAADAALISYLRQNSTGSVYANAMSPLVCQQVLQAFRVLATPAGLAKIQGLKEKANYFRHRLIDMGLDVLGDDGSPVVPVMIYSPGKVAAFSRMALDRGVAVVVVGFPATPLMLSRTRFCVSAGHSKEDLDKALEVIEELAHKLLLRYRVSSFG